MSKRRNKLKARLYRRRYEVRMRFLMQRLRSWLIAELGGKCVVCGTRFDLQFDHPFGREWKRERMNNRRRMRRYFADWRNGNLRLLCGYHNLLDGRYRQRHFGLPLYDPDLLAFDTESKGG